jgi:di/tripeptidase
MTKAEMDIYTDPTDPVYEDEPIDNTTGADGFDLPNQMLLQ